MGIEYSFVDNAIYGPEDINDITRSLTGAGVAPFLSKDSYNVSDLNVLTEALVTDGTSLGGCKCTVADANTADMQVNVAQGIIFFESGVRLEVDEDGCIIELTPNTAGYVYAHYSPSLQRADIVFGSVLPTDGEYVLLAAVSADGGIRDIRTYAKSKVATVGKNVLLSMPFVAVDKTLIREADNIKYYLIAKVTGVDLSRFNYVMVPSFDQITTTTEIPHGCLYDLNNDRGVFSLRGYNNSPWAGNVFYTPNYNVSYLAEVLENEICIVARTENQKYIGMDFSGCTATFI